MIRTRFAAAADRDRLVDFIREHWIATHVFTERPDLLEWQHLGADGRLNFVLAEEDDAILGILGFIPLGHFDPELGVRDVTLAIWKVRDVGVPPGVGLNLLKFLRKELDPRLIAAIGTSQMVRPLYKALRYSQGVMHHHALFGPGGRAVIASGVPDTAYAAAVPDARVRLSPVTSDAPPELRQAIDRIAGDAVPAKSWTYLATRYLAHPWYRYELRAVHVDGRPVAVVVWRAVTAEGSSVLRIVDIVGDTDWLAPGAAALQQEVAAAGAEYLDLVQWGIDPDRLGPAWVSPATTEGLVLPNYFAPFERRNVEIGTAVRVFDDSSGPVHLYRADSDQDRPNRAVDLS